MIDGRLLAAAEADFELGHLVDAPHPGAPLVIAFGFVDWHGPARFDFARRLMKLEAGGLRHNRILVRDTANLWYQHGVAGLGDDADAVAGALRRLVDATGPNTVTCVGQSMGGYAAILFACLIGADRALAFGPLSYLDPIRARADGELRWLATMETIARHPPARCYDDLANLLAATADAPVVRIVHGTAPEADGGINLDHLHADRLAAHPTVTVERIAGSGHAVVADLVRQRVLDEMLTRDVLAAGGGYRVPAAPTVPRRTWEAVTDEWRGWVFENLALGAEPEGLLAEMVARTLHPGSAQRAINAARASPYLAAARRLVPQARSTSRV